MREAAAEWVAISNLTAWDQNPRDNDGAVAEVAESIKRFGWGAPILARQHDNEVIAGHTRLKAAKLLGLDHVPMRFLDLDPAEAHMLALADNKLNERASWSDGLGHVLAELEADRCDLNGLGWDNDELELLISGADVPDFSPGTEDDQGRLDELEPKMVTCPHCGESWDERKHGQS